MLPTNSTRPLGAHCERPVSPAGAPAYQGSSASPIAGGGRPRDWTIDAPRRSTWRPVTSSRGAEVRSHYISSQALPSDACTMRAALPRSALLRTARVSCSSIWAICDTDAARQHRGGGRGGGARRTTQRTPRPASALHVSLWNGTMPYIDSLFKGKPYHDSPFQKRLQWVQ